MFEEFARCRFSALSRTGVRIPNS